MDLIQSELFDRFSFRLMGAQDIDKVPIMCQGERREILARIKSLGSSAVVVFEGKKHIAQLQFRAHVKGSYSPNGLWDPLYWGDFKNIETELPTNTLVIYCYHVGQIDDTENRNKEYQGLGIGRAMLEYLLDWAEEAGFSSIAVKATPESRPVMSFMGGQPVSVYESYGFKVIGSAIDEQLLNVVMEKGLASKETNLNDIALVSLCVKHFD